MNVLNYINKIPEGYSEGIYMNAKYGITKSAFNNNNNNNNKSFKVYAKELKGTNFISLNYYITSTKKLLKPCEMPEQKVIHFLEHVTLK